MTAIVIRADTRQLPLPDASVDLIVTSPPYFGLRSYTDGGEHYTGQIGAEDNPAAWLTSMTAATREWMRVLKPTGSMFVNLGDKYSDRAGPEWVGSSDRLTGRPPKPRRKSSTQMAPRKSLLGLPWRYALACVDDLGLILREDLIWSKPNGLPESVSDRCRRSHEYWFHLTKAPRYFSAIDEIREQYAPDTARRYTSGYRFDDSGRPAAELTKGVNYRDGDAYDTNPLGKMPGSVWTIPTEPLTVPAHLGVDHFAAFPTAWPKRLIRGWSPTGVCTACGEGRAPATTKTLDLDHMQARGASGYKDADEPQGNRRGINADHPNGRTVATIIGYRCACTPYTDHPGIPRDPDKPRNNGTGWAGGTGDRDQPPGGYGNAPRTGPWREYHCDAWTPPPVTQAIVLDPFGGTGTTALVAHALGRIGISVDLSHDYSRLAMWRTRDRNQLAKVLAVDKPPVESAGQEAMF